MRHSSLGLSGVTRLGFLSAMLLIAGVAGCGGSSDQPEVRRGADESGRDERLDPATSDKASADHQEPSDNSTTSGSGTPKSDTEDRTPTDAAPATTDEETLRRARELAGEDATKRDQATAHFDRMGKSAAAAVLVRLMKDGDAQSRKGALFYLLGNFDATDPVVVDVFVASLSDTDTSVRHIALQAVRRLPAEDALRALPKLAQRLDDPDETENNRRAVATLLASLRARTEVVLPSLIRAAVEDPSPRVRTACVQTIRKIGTTSESLPLLEKTLTSDKAPLVRRASATQLKQLGAEALPVVDSMCGALKDPDRRVREPLTEALIALGEQAVQPVAGQLDSEDAGVRENALFILGKIGPAAKPATEAIRGRLQDDDPRVRRLAQLVLEALRTP